MKTNKYIFAAAAAFAAISCAKDNTAVVETAEKHIVRTTIEVTTDALTKADFNLNKDETAYQVSWENGDKVLVLQQGGKDAGGTAVHETAMNEFTYGNGAFQGDIENPRAGSKWHAFYPYGIFTDFSSTAHIVYATLPDSQTGEKSNFNNGYIMYKLNVDPQSETPAGQPATTLIDDVSLSFTMKGFSSIIKLNVPEALNLKKIELTATDADGTAVALAGKIKLQTAKGDKGMINGGEGKVNRGNKSKITVENDNDKISGDVYIYLLPDSYNSDAEPYYSSAAKLNFSFTNADGAVCDKVVDIDPGHPLRGGVLHNFGSLPEVLPFPFDFQLTVDPEDDFKVVPINAPTGTTFKYNFTKGDTEYKDRTGAPIPEDNLYFTVTGTYNGATKTYGGYYRVWVLNGKADNQFAIDATKAGYTSGATKGVDGTFTSNDLSCYIPATDGKITYNDAYMQFNGQDGNPSTLTYNTIYDCMVSFGTKIASNGAKNRQFVLYKNNVQVGSYTTTTTSPAVSWAVDNISAKAGDAVKGAPARSGQRVYRIVILQWGENVKAETKSVTAESLSGTHNYDI